MLGSRDGEGGRGRRSRRSGLRLRVLMFGATALVLTGFVLAAYAAGVLNDSELDTVDARFAIRGDLEPPEDVVIVGIDDPTFRELGEQWPFPRSLHAEAIKRLTRDGARAIVYDVQFTEPSNPTDDEALAGAIERAGNVVLATTVVDDRGRSNVFGGPAVLRDLRTRAGHAGFETDPGRVVRRTAPELEKLETLPLAAVETADRADVDRARFPERAWIDYHGRTNVRRVPFYKLLRGEVPPEIFKGKIVVVGATAPSLQDVHSTSASGEEFMYGVEIQANAISTLLRDFPLKEAPSWTAVLLIVLFGAVGPLLALRFGPVRAALIGVALIAGYAVWVQFLFNEGRIVSLLYPEASLSLGLVGALGVGLAVNAFERERVRDLFSRFVPEQVVDEVLKDVDEDLRLGGEHAIVTVLFSDVRGFTTFSESKEPEVVIEVLNQYLTRMTDVILAHGGTLVSFLGDGILAVFGAPIEHADHADRALATARSMTGEALESFNAWMRAEGHGDGFRIGVGLNSGAVMAGNVGSEKRLEYTVIGDTTNTASRLEGLTKGTPYMIFMSESTRLMLLEEQTDLVNAGDLDVRGRALKVTVWSVNGSNGERPEASKLS